MAKDLISNDYPGPVVELLGNMIQSQIIDYYNYGLNSPHALVILWIQCITNHPNWINDYSSLYLIDLILRVAFQFPDAWICAREYFRSLIKPSFLQKSASFFPFLSGSQTTNQFLTPNPKTLWLSLLTLEIEHELFENKLWPELLRQLTRQVGKNGLDLALKVC